MAGSLRRLIEDLAVVKPGRKTSRSMSDAAKAALGLDLPITDVLDNTLGPAAQASGRRGCRGRDPLDAVMGLSRSVPGGRLSLRVMM